MTTLELQEVSFWYGRGTKKNTVLVGANASFRRGSFYALTGRSGAGKSTLMSLLAALCKPCEGRILFEGRDIQGLDPLAYRRRCVSTIYQDFALFPLLNVTENICYPMELQGVPIQQQRQRLEALIRQVNLGPELLTRYPSAISGGEQQRVAIARALATGAAVLLADEPTGNLDEANAAQIVDLLRRSAHEEDRCVIMVTHDTEAANAADAVLRLSDGRLEWC